MYRDRVVATANVLCVCVTNAARSRAYTRGRSVVERVLSWHRPGAMNVRYATMPPVEYGAGVVDGELVADAVVGGGWAALETAYECVWFAGCSMMDFALGPDRIGRIVAVRRALRPGGLVFFTQVPEYSAQHNPTAVDNAQQLVAVEHMKFGPGAPSYQIGSPEQLEFLGAWRAVFQEVQTPVGPVYKATLPPPAAAAL